jgi:hypothetical protein
LACASCGGSCYATTGVKVALLSTKTVLTTLALEVVVITTFFVELIVTLIPGLGEFNVDLRQKFNYDMGDYGVGVGLLVYRLFRGCRNRGTV